MKKYFVFLLLLIGVVAFAQDTTSVTIDYVEGQPIMDFLKANWMAFAFVVYSMLEYWLGKTKKLEPNSVLGIVFGFVGRWLKKK